MKLLKFLLKMGFHGIRHKAAEARLEKWMHDNGLGA